MQYIKGLEAYKGAKRSAVTLGKFDGLHRGHEKLVEKVRDLGINRNLASIVCAFDMLPLKRKLNLPEQVLMTKEERKLRLDGQVDYLIDCPFTEAFAKMEAEIFIKEVIAGVFQAGVVVVGADFRFGFGKRGDIRMLAEYAKEYDYELIVIEKERYEGRVISSTYIREELQKGNLELVKTLLGYPYTIAGLVEQGKKLGRTLGFPTVNVPPAPEKMMPPRGVYLGRVYVDGDWYNAIGNVGVKPTVSDSNRELVESFLFDYEGDAYGKEVLVELYKFCRPEQKFADVAEMKDHIHRDIAYGKEYFQKYFGNEN